MARLGFGTLLLYSFFFSILRTFTALDTINPIQSLRDGETLVSAGQTFELGFFSLADPNRRYLGSWYKKIFPRTMVWVANRETPLANTLGSLNITAQGNLVLVNVTNYIFWSSNTSTIAKDPVARLLDTGNFVISDATDGNPENFLWQSFDYPDNTVLPEMKFGVNLVTGHETFSSSWRSIEDPAPGQFSVHLDLRGYPQLFLKKENRIQYRAGSWNAVGLTGTPVLKPNPIFTFEFVSNDNEMYFKYDVPNNSILARYTLHPSGLLQRFQWNERANDWVVIAAAQTDQCNNYAFCGAYASCELNNSPVCLCLDGFMPKSPRDWNMLLWSDGCVPRTPLDCVNGDGFLKHTGIKLPDTSSSWYDEKIDLKQCHNLCLRNCSCSAYANLDMRDGGSGCLLWFGDLIDMRRLGAGGQDLYVRMAASELEKTEKKRSSIKKILGIIFGSVAEVISMLMVFCICWRNLRKHGMLKKIRRKNDHCEGREEEMELPMFDLTTIVDATNNFSSSNKLGEGGFGPVYKGTSSEGQEIAVKRLSKSSGQGLREFKNEVILIAKLQHRNLVKLLGCYIHEDEKMLIYEYMPNKSLDFFIFDQTRRKLLDWCKRIQIIDGIARGLIYLHQDSRLRIIHRDLKTSNILLDSDMNPKISDFGLARIFGGDQTEAKTKRVVGTYGYMSPEYAVDGLFSVKSDLFSFGVLVLEIVSGKKNRGFCHPDHDRNLLGHAWILWTNETPLELIDDCLRDSCIASEVIRCINVALLCVQKRPEDRPNMASVVVMLSSENSLPQPKQPGFFTERSPPEADTSSNEHQSYSANEISLSLFEAR
ncbi:hypothetical protein P3X46_027080 [Hevea brasiliensis]|uniref:Receptor-like serine/threonine-protein kinase n=1 Tax=Hevea brasiliensis TaxID=3981 RepID=A0ABQ9KYP8_HEVBR|nr:G-type lectin S-receptor-like serine/threonine-protein kinase At4g27290 isoform X4 [Hevea brasiliensis]KAJ9153662.1 hypothetical protein P3X46_027080 [Hevea brasiliensis]